MTREVKNGKMAFKGGQCGRIDHHVWQVVPGINNTVREKVFGGISGAMRFQQFIVVTSSSRVVDNTKSSI